MYLKHHTPGIVLSGRAEGADSRRAYIFTRDFGLISVKIQGARNLCSRLRAGSQDLTLGEFSLVHGKVGWRLVSARPRKNLFEVFRDQPEKLRIICNISNLIKKLIGEEAKLKNETNHKHSNIFVVLDNFFDFLQNAQMSEVTLAECLILMRILHGLGYMQHDPEFVMLLSSTSISIQDLVKIAPRQSQIIALINASLKTT